MAGLEERKGNIKSKAVGESEARESSGQGRVLVPDVLQVMGKVEIYFGLLYVHIYTYIKLLSYLLSVYMMMDHFKYKAK